MTCNKKIKFCFVMPFHIMQNRGGGAEVQAWLLAKELSVRDFEVHYICESVLSEKVGKTEKIDNVIITWLKKSGRFQWIDRNKYYKALAAIEPDIVIQRMSSCVTDTIGAYCKSDNKKFVWICTDNVAPSKKMHLIQQKKVRLANKKAFYKKTILNINARINDYLRNRGMKKVDFAFTQNNYQKENFKKNYNIISHKMISGHEIPGKKLSAQKKYNNKQILWVANLAPKKRPELFSNLAKIMSNEEYKFIIVGSREEQKYLDDLFEDKPLNLEWLGYLPFEACLDCFDTASLFINTSTYKGEGFPNTFIQAWMRKTPVLTLNVDPDSVIEKNKLGYVCKDIFDMSAKIKRLLNDYALYSELSENVYKYAVKNHSIDVMTDNFLGKIL